MKKDLEEIKRLKQDAILETEALKKKLIDLQNSKEDYERNRNADRKVIE